MTAAPEPLVRLAQRVERRIAELALEYAEVCRRAGISDETLGKIRKGIKARGSTYLKLERALEWAPGSISAILAGGEPTPLDTHADRRAAVKEEAAASAARSSLSSRELELVTDLAVSAAEKLGLSPDEAREAFRRALVRIEQNRAEGRSDPLESPRSRRAG
ncbi:hypothetical protein ACFOOM_07780 [Streptomyces echinoruber]|nr:hypothetical protein [Streptomyces echinoruber]